MPNNIALRMARDLLSRHGDEAEIVVGDIVSAFELYHHRDLAAFWQEVSGKVAAIQRRYAARHPGRHPGPRPRFQ